MQHHEVTFDLAVVTLTYKVLSRLYEFVTSLFMIFILIFFCITVVKRIIFQHGLKKFVL